MFRNSFWPNGSPAMPRPARDEATKMRTRVAAKMALLSCIPGKTFQHDLHFSPLLISENVFTADEIKHLIGSETTRQGVLRVFDLLQNPVLNRRLVYSFLEEIIDTLYPEQKIPEFFEKLNSSSPK